MNTIIWDLDGTLIDSFGIFTEVLGEILPSHGKELPPQEVLMRNYHGSLADSINQALGGISSNELAAIERDFLEVQNTHYEVVEHHLLADGLRLVQRAHEAGLRQVLVTNRNHEGRLNASPRHIVEHSSLNGLIDTIVCGDDSEHRKPKPDVVGSLLENNTIIPAQSLVVGDQFVDGEFARNLGTKAVLVDRNGGIPHLERLGDDWAQFITIVSSLDNVVL